MTTLLAYLMGAIGLGFLTTGDRPRPVWTLVLVVAAFVIGASFYRLSTL